MMSFSCYMFAKLSNTILSSIQLHQSQTDELFEHLLRELLGLNKQLRSIRGSLKVEVAKKARVGRAHF